MKGAALARYVARPIRSRPGLSGGRGKAGVSPDKKLDARGKEYDWNVYMRGLGPRRSNQEDGSQGQLPSMTLELNQIYVDTVWTLCCVDTRTLLG